VSQATQPTESPAQRDHSLWLEITNDKVSEVVQQLLEHAVAAGASDLFLLAEPDHVAVMARHLGVLRPVSRLSAELGKRCQAHIKGLADMDIAEKRRPLDGRWKHQRADGSIVDLRINTVPTLYGEDFTLRILVRDKRLLDLAELGMLRRDLNELLKLLSSPSGLILVTGPTGAGKTTTLYACLQSLNNGKRKLNSIEDPIEYALPGIRQTQVNPAIGVGFAELLRSTLRQAPDVIMVGEIRDPETAEIAVRAANSGHLVLATLHAPVTAAAVQSMLSFGALPFQLASSLLGVISQRLLRTLDPATKVPYEIGLIAPMLEEIKRWLEPGLGEKIYGPGREVGQKAFGYSGQIGIFEVMSVTDAIRHLIVERQPTNIIRQQAIADGMISLRHAALLAIARGQTSVEEVFRVVPSEYLVAGS
jgi:type II secretory ATPase GspE/PulE/Tfp pilus assembly ATPase PilB-like protein